MTETRKYEIAESFPDKFDQATLAIEISASEFKTLEKGIFATSMEDKWNIFVLNNILYLSRSWTHFCIFKVFTQKQNEKIFLTKFQVNRNNKQYRGVNIESDLVSLKKILQAFLSREDFYIDPKLELPLIKSMLEKIDPNSEFKRQIGSNDVGLTKKIHDNLTTKVEAIGWTELKNKIVNMNDREPLISLYLQNRQTNFATTYYFDKDASELLGQITINEKRSR